MGRWNSDRWEPAGTNSAGDPMYERNLKAGNAPVAVSGEMTKAELQAEAEARGLPTSGTKAELIERLAG